jgi:hypothetical protein
MQKLSPEARRRKKVRDKAVAMSPRRRAMKAENQRKRRAAKKNGKNIDGMDYDHTTIILCICKTKPIWFW